MINLELVIESMIVLATIYLGYMLSQKSLMTAHKQLSKRIDNLEKDISDLRNKVIYNDIFKEKE